MATMFPVYSDDGRFTDYYPAPTSVDKRVRCPEINGQIARTKSGDYRHECTSLVGIAMISIFSAEENQVGRAFRQDNKAKQYLKY
jgi:hypothetical protein